MTCFIIVSLYSRLPRILTTTTATLNPITVIFNRAAHTAATNHSLAKQGWPWPKLVQPSPTILFHQPPFVTHRTWPDSTLRPSILPYDDCPPHHRSAHVVRPTPGTTAQSARLVAGDAGVGVGRGTQLLGWRGARATQYLAGEYLPLGRHVGSATGKADGVRAGAQAALTCFLCKGSNKNRPCPHDARCPQMNALLGAPPKKPFPLPHPCPFWIHCFIIFIVRRLERIRLAVSNIFFVCVSRTRLYFCTQPLLLLWYLVSTIDLTLNCLASC